jgi:hypothetical protein
MAFNASTDFNLNAAMATVGSPNVSYATNLTGITRPAPAPRYRYPQKSIGKDDDYLEIGVIEYVPPGFETGKDNLKLKTGTEKNSNQKAKFTIQLPIPANIGDTNQVNWGDDRINALTAFGAEQFGNVLKSSGFGGGIMGMINSAVGTGKEVLLKGGGQEMIKQSFTSALVNSLGANTSPEGLLSRAQGSVLNPNLELLFKQSMAPKTGSNATGAGLFIDAPNVFLLKYKTGSRDHPYLNKFKPCALTNMGVNYTGSGSYATYADKTPVHMKLNLSFTELNPIYNEDYDSNVGKQAVGY